MIHSLVTDTVTRNVVREWHRTRKGAQSTAERVSSGNRITEAGDDAAALGVAENLEAFERSSRVALKNANDGLSVVAVSEGAAREVQGILKRMRELATQASSEALGQNERLYANEEWKTHEREIERLARTTKFNGIATSNGSNASMAIQVGARNTVNDKVRIKMVDLRKTTVLGATGSNPLGNSTLAQRALTRIDRAMDKLNKQVSGLGAHYNQLNAAVSSIENSVVNHQASQMRIRDADMAHETAEMAKQEILGKAALSALSQSRLQKQQLLSLI